MARDALTHFDFDGDKLRVLEPCMDNSGVGCTDAEWPNNLISRKSVVYESGVIVRAGATVRHLVAPEEFALCRSLSADASAILRGSQIPCSESGNEDFEPFFIAANVDETPPQSISPELIRERFGGTIFPLAAIIVEPLASSGRWWSDVENYFGSDDEEALARWSALLRWFEGRAEFRDRAFVRIGEWQQLLELMDNRQSEFPEGTELTGCVLPRLALGLTIAGSLAGVFFASVET
jgi:hypothetical protein